MATSQRPWTVPAGSFQRTLQKDAPVAAGAMDPNSSDALGVSGVGAAGSGAEVDELHRAYRIMELTRKQSSEESANTLRMQRQQIEKLKKDNDRLKEDLALETRQARQANNISGTAQIAKLQDQGDIYTRKIETEKRRLEELDKQIRRLQQNILVARKEMGGIHATRDSNSGVQKQIRILENRLDKALVKFNEALAHNKSLREQIDNLRRERVVFDGIYHKLARELQRKKANMHELMAEANRAVEVRTQAQQEMVALKAAADREQEHFEEEWKQLGLLIDVDRRAKENAHKAGERDRLLGHGGGRGGDPAVEAEQSLRKRVTKGAWGIATDKASIHLSMEKVQAYEEAFAAIQKATRITDIDALVQEFVQAEDANFSLFNYVNDLAAEVERMDEQQAAVREQRERLQGTGAQANDSDLQRKKLLAELDAQLHKHNARAQASQEQFARGQHTLQALKAGVGAIFARLGCGQAGGAAAQLLGGNAGVTESNLMQYLGLIEQRTNELLGAYQRHREELGPGMGGDAHDEQQHAGDVTLARTQRGDSAATYGSTSTARGSSGVSGQQQQQHGADVLSIRAPSAAAFDDGDDDEADADGDLQDDAQPMSREQLQARQRGEQY